MKNLKALFSLIISLFLARPAQAGIVYGSQWVHPETNNMVFLLGDHHDTHLRSAEGDNLQVQEFKKNFESAEKSILILREDNFVRNKDNSFFTQINTRLSSIDRSNFPYLYSLTIDFRNILDLMETANLCENFLDITDPTSISFDIIIDQIEEVINNCKKLMNQTIERVKFCIDKTPNTIAKSIFTETFETLTKNQTFFEQGIEFIKTTHGDLQNPGNFDVFFKHIKKIFTFFIREYHFRNHYQSIMVETEAILRITQHSKECNKFIVSAGAYHLINLEKWLFQLGYKRKKTANSIMEIYIILEKKRNNLAFELKKIALESTDSSYFFDPNDQKLDYFSIALDHQINQRESSSKLLEITSELENFYEKNLKNVPLVPIETFSWINKDTDDAEAIADITAPIKRKTHDSEIKEDNQSDKQEAQFISKRQQPERKCRYKKTYPK